ncbi:MAG: hypothetical protein HY079_03885 [Elusimicrobia bacterium]|nr:hypothetical protein [Elusimicrobiota bacterium]
MSGGRPPHAVLVRDPERFSPPAVAAVLGRRAGAPALDFAASARRAWGLVAESLPAADADSLAADLTAAGQPALAAPSSLLEDPPPPTAVGKCELAGDGFDLVSGRANAAPERLSWTKLAALCAGAVEERTAATVTEGGGPREAAERAVRLGLTMATGLPLMKGKTETKRVVERRERALVLDLLFLEPARRLRVDARSFDFSVLGPKMTYAAEPNFLALLEELCSRAPRALRGKGTRALLARRPAAESLYESYDDLSREERWLLTLSALRAAP